MKEKVIFIFLMTFFGFAHVSSVHTVDSLTIIPQVEGYHLTPALKVREQSRIYVGGDITGAVSIQANTKIVRVLLAGDEEMSSESWGLWGQTLTWDNYAKEQVAYASWELDNKFDVVLHVATVTTYQSDNSYGISPALLDDAVRKLNFRTPMIFNGVWVDILVVFSDSRYADIELAGVAYDNGIDPHTGNPCAACMIKPQRDDSTNMNLGWTDMNLVQHEISHFYGAPDHIDESYPHYNDDCIMSYRYVYVTTLFKYGYYITINDWIPLTYATNNYCSDCYETINSNRTKYGYVNPPPLFPSANEISTGGGNNGTPKPW